MRRNGLTSLWLSLVILWAAGLASAHGAWGQFSDIPITANLMADVNGDGNMELLVGCKDGFVRVYRISDGAILGKVCVGSPVTGIAAQGSNIVVGSRGGVGLYDASLKEKGALNIRAVSVVALKGKTPAVCVADETGTVYALGF